MADQTSAGQEPRFEPLEHWIVPGEGEQKNRGLILGGDLEAKKFAMIAFAATDARPVLLFPDEEKARATGALIRKFFDQPASARIGGNAMSGIGTGKPGVRWVGFPLKKDASGQMVPDTDHPQAQLWVLPHRNRESVALMDPRNASGEEAELLGVFIDQGAADNFVEVFDALIEHTSSQVG